MGSAVFSEYAEFYDLLYRDKDYAGEAEFVRSLIRKTRPEVSRPTRVLDLACGTGRHALELEKMGFAVEGSDLSERMVAAARATAQARGSKIVFHNQSFQTADRIEGKFDAVISMFSAVGYLAEVADFALMLRNVRGLLAEGGVFLFDYWNGNAVVRDYSPVKTLRKRDGEREILRLSETSLDLVRQIAEVRFTCMSFKGAEKKGEFEELHPVRFFFFREMEALLAAGGFRIVSSSPFLELDQPVRPYDWNVSVVAVPV